MMYPYGNVVNNLKIVIFFSTAFSLHSKASMQNRFAHNVVCMQQEFMFDNRFEYFLVVWIILHYFFFSL